MKHSRSTLFLMELIITILFFSLASTVCIQLFAKSHTLSKQTMNENHAVIQAQNLAESFLATEGDLEQMKSLFDTSTTDFSENTVTLLFDQNWKECAPDIACYTASLVSYPEADGLITADIMIAPYDPSTDPIYSLTVKHHIAERRGNLDN